MGCFISVAAHRYEINYHEKNYFLQYRYQILSILVILYSYTRTNFLSCSRGATTDEKLRGTKAWVTTLGLLPKAGLSVGCGRGSLYCCEGSGV